MEQLGSFVDPKSIPGLIVSVVGWIVVHILNQRAASRRAASERRRHRLNILEDMVFDIAERTATCLVRSGAEEAVKVEVQAIQVRFERLRVVIAEIFGNRVPSKLDDQRLNYWQLCTGADLEVHTRQPLDSFDPKLLGIRNDGMALVRAISEASAG